MEKIDDNFIFDHFGEIEAWVINGKKYEWNAGFHIPIFELKKKRLEQLPLNEKIYPIEKENDEYMIPFFPDLCLVRTLDGVVANVESIFISKYWSHEVVSMKCFIECLVAEVRSNKEFQLLEVETKDPENVVIEYETKLVDVQSTSEAIKSAVHSMKSLEKRVNWRIADKLVKWAREIKQ